jgi:hypothetical protein
MGFSKTNPLGFMDPLGFFAHPASAPQQTIQEPAVDTAALSGGQQGSPTASLLNTKGQAQGQLSDGKDTTRQSILGGGS